MNNYVTVAYHFYEKYKVYPLHRKFPSLINCCTIDWFQPWPEDALEMVANKFLEDVNLDFDVKNSVVKMCKNFHTSVTSLSDKLI